MSEAHTTPYKANSVIKNRYVVTRCLGRGTMGTVYLCRDTALGDRTIVLKLLYSKFAQDQMGTSRFLGEIKAIYDINHPNVVRAFEYICDDDIKAFTMEYVDGGDLERRLKLEKRLPIAEVARLLAQICAGVKAIHKAGIIHRDLKPENVLLSRNGDVKIADFGVAHLIGEERLTKDGGLVGSIPYMSPEYVSNGKFDARSDVYAIGVIAYEMITGDIPFRSDSVYETLKKRLTTEPIPPHHLRPDCPKGLSSIVMKAMACSPSTRYQSASQFITALAQVDLSGRDDPISLESDISLSHHSLPRGTRRGTFSSSRWGFLSGSLSGSRKRVYSLLPAQVNERDLFEPLVPMPSSSHGSLGGGTNIGRYSLSGQRLVSTISSGLSAVTKGTLSRSRPLASGSFVSPLRQAALLSVKTALIMFIVAVLFLLIQGYSEERQAEMEWLKKHIAEHASKYYGVARDREDSFLKDVAANRKRNGGGSKHIVQSGR